MSYPRPMLIGMHNPVYPDRDHALWPSPPGCTGDRVLKLLRRQRPEVTDEQYLAVFDRRNLLYEREWDRGRARAGAQAIIAEVDGTGREILVLGDKVRELLGLPKRRLAEVRAHGCKWRQIPHPSGRCRWYNEEFCRDVVAFTLQEMFELYCQESGE